MLILAAGSGSRFRSAVPKLLAPVTRGQGMLELLLHTLLQDLQVAGEQLTVVVAGWSAPAIETLVREIDGSIQLRRVLGSSSEGPMHSLAAALQEQPAPAPRTWVLHGDTHYPRCVLQRLLAAPIADRPVLVLEPTHREDAAVEVGVRLDATGRVIALGTDAHQSWPWRMLPAVAWPAGLAGRILAAGHDPLQRRWSQWQLLNTLLQEQPGHTLQALTVQSSGIFDVDTLRAWNEARRRFQAPP
jgi:CTP:molybdopterin cytidylyltransferase MocA